MTRQDRLLISLSFLCLGVLLNFGDLSLGGLILVVAAMALAAHSAAVPVSGRPMSATSRAVVLILLAMTAILYIGHVPDGGAFALTAPVIGLAIVIFSVARGRALRALACAAGAAAAAANLVVNITWGAQNIDVFDFQQAASRALLSGHNPYGPVVPSPEVTSPGVYAQLPLHFPYGPILPILEAPFRLLGDVRVFHVLAAAATVAAVLLLAHRAGTTNLTTRVLMAFPLFGGMVIFSWVDVITMASFATWMVLFRSHPRWAVAALALGLGVKPTTLVVLVPVLFWSVRARRQVPVAAGLAALVVVPFAAATGFSHFYYDVLGIQLAVEPRVDSLTINSYLDFLHKPMLTVLASGAIIGVTTLLVLCRRPTTYGQLLAGTAVVVTVSFLVAKWAYFNYYFIPAILLLLAVAGANLALDDPEMIRPPAALLWAREQARRISRRIPLPGRVADPVT